MKHCVLMTVYKDPKLINHIIELAPNNFDFYVHIDKKSKIKKNDILSRAIVYKEYKIYWGGMEHLLAFLKLLSEASNNGREYDFYHLITGQDFWCCPFSSFDSLLKKDHVYMEIHQLPRFGWHNGGYDLLKLRTISSYCDIRKPINKCINKLLILLQRMAGVYRSLPKYDMACGSVYMSLPDGAINTILHGDIAVDLLGRCKNTFCCEEIYFQTVLLNSSYKNKIINNNLRYIDWNVHNGPKILEINDWAKISEEDFLFCRKIDSSKSQMLIEKLENHIKCE